MKKTILLLAIYLPVFLQAQNNMEILWQGCYGGSENDYASSIVPTENGYLGTVIN